MRILFLAGWMPSNGSSTSYRSRWRSVSFSRSRAISCSLSAKFFGSTDFDRVRAFTGGGVPDVVRADFVEWFLVSDAVTIFRSVDLEAVRVRGTMLVGPRVPFSSPTLDIALLACDRGVVERDKRDTGIALGRSEIESCMDPGPMFLRIEVDSDIDMDSTPR